MARNRSIERRCLVLTAALLVAATAQAQTQTEAWSASYRLESAGQYAEAQAQIAEMATRQPANELAVIRSAWLSHLQGKYAEAETLYLKARQVNPRSMEALLGLMLPRMAQLRWLDAIETGRKALAENAWDYNAHVRIMVCEEALSRWDALAKHAAEVSVRFPADATSLVYWARAESALRNTRRARQLYGQVLERFPNHAEANKYIKGTS